MSLFSKWSGSITLPEKQLFKEKIGGNYVSQVAINEQEVQVDLYDSPFNGFELIRTSLSGKFRELLIKYKGAKSAAPKGYLVLSLKAGSSLQNLSEAQFKWENLEVILTDRDTPQKVLDSWRSKFIFKEEHEGEVGLRPPQIGAIHAVAAHYSVSIPLEPATVVLPTGTGKTETMLGIFTYRRIEKLLVLVPSNALRNQLSEKFFTLGILPNIGILKSDIPRPFVAVIKKGIMSTADATSIVEKSNVIVATPQILKSSSAESIKVLTESCTDLFIDEAHHSTASTWEEIRLMFKSKRITQFTATPFRNDNHHIGGKIIFNYKLGDAQKSDYYKPIRLIPIEEYGDLNDTDVEIAKKSVQILTEDVTSNPSLDHILMARTDKISRAKEVYSIYSEIASSFNPILIHGNLSKGEVDEALEKLKSKGSRIVVCVNMLGEGFDLPNLKIAAIHDGHKSLAITLQFIGRFTRKAINVGDAAVIVNIADPKTQKSLEKLYSQGADWDDLIKRLSEERIERELNLQEVIENLKSNGDLSKQISLWNLKPNFTTQLFKTNCDQWHPMNYSKSLPSNLESWHSFSEDDNILVVMGIQESPVKWGSHQELSDSVYKLLIAYWASDNNALFIFSNDYTAFRTEKLVEDITGGQSTLISGPSIFNILNNVQLPLVKNLGAAKVGAISFTQYFGSNVTEGLAEIEKLESELSNIACLGYEDGERIIWGGSQRKGKVWAVKTGSIQDWKDWCDKTWLKVDSDDTEAENITKDFLRPTKLLSNYAQPAISAQWGEHVQLKREDKVYVFFGDQAIQLYFTSLEIIDTGNNNGTDIQIKTEENVSVYRFQIDEQIEGGYSYTLISGLPVSFRYGEGGVVKPLQEQMIVDPFILRYADGTHSYNNYHIDLKMNAGLYPVDLVEAWDWSGIDLRKESMGKSMEVDSIQYQTFRNIENDYEVIFNDDASGEAGDLVALRESDDKSKIELCLIHCKNAKDGVVGSDIDNFYTLCGQAQKSIRWKHIGIGELSIHLRRRHQRWQETGHSRLLKGDIQRLVYFKNKSRTTSTSFKTMIVQPGVSKNRISDNILRLLGTTELYLRKTTEAEFVVVCSD
ncbi:DEAD/DEAH box helicase [Ekhidna sp.]